MNMVKELKETFSCDNFELLFTTERSSETIKIRSVEIFERG